MIEIKFKNVATKVIIQRDFYIKEDKETVTFNYEDLRDILETMFRYGEFVEKTGCLPDEIIFGASVN